MLKQLTRYVGPVKGQLPGAVLGIEIGQPGGGVAGNAYLVGQALEDRSKGSECLARRFIGIFGALGEHGPALLIGDQDVEAFFGLLKNEIVADRGDDRVFAPGLFDAGGGEGKARRGFKLGPLQLEGLRLGALLFRLVVVFGFELTFALIGFLGQELEKVPLGRAFALDNAGAGDGFGKPERITHRAGHDLQFSFVLDGKRNDEHEKADKNRHEVGKGHQPFGDLGLIVLLARGSGRTRHGQAAALSWG